MKAFWRILLTCALCGVLLIFLFVCGQGLVSLGIALLFAAYPNSKSRVPDCIIESAKPYDESQRLTKETGCRLHTYTYYM